MADTSTDISERTRRLREAIGGILLAIDEGERPSRDEWVARHPEFAEEIERFLQGQQDFAHRAVPMREDAAPTPTRVLGSDSAARHTLLPFETVGDFEILEEIAHGGMGIVYKARQKSLQRVVALKMVLGGGLASAEDLQRFQAEAAAAAVLDHPNIVPIYEVGRHEGCPFFTMKWIDGCTLAASIAQGHWSAHGTASATGAREVHRRAAKLLAQVAHAVHFAHQHGILHRDLKPGNILLSNPASSTTHHSTTHHSPLTTHHSPVPFVSDFGLAKRFQEDSNLTQTGAIVGTPSYMSPEQATGSRHLTTAADVYSLGAILYELLVGRKPFQGETPMATVLMVQNSEPMSPRSIDRAIDRDMETIVLKCLEKDARRRYSSAEQFAEDLEHWLRGEPIVASPCSAWQRGWKWARRHPAAVAALATFAIVGVVSFSFITWQWREAVAARDREAEQRAKVEIAAYSGQLAFVERELWTMLGERDLELLQHTVDQCPPELRGWEWRFLRSAVRRGGRPLFGQPPCGVHALVFSPDSSRLIVAGAAEPDEKPVLGVYRFGEPKELIRFTGHQGHIRCLAQSADGSRIVTGGDDGNVYVWNSESGKNLCKLPGHVGAITAMALRPDGQKIVSVGEDRTLRWWDVGTKQGTSIEERSEASRIVFAPTGRQFVTAGKEAKVTLWDGDTGRVVGRICADAGPVSDLAISPCGMKLLTTEVHRARLWQLPEGQPICELKHKNISCATFSPDGTRLVTGGTDKRFRFWDTSGRFLVGFENEFFYPVEHLVFSPDGVWLFTGAIWKVPLE